MRNSRRNFLATVAGREATALVPSISFTERSSTATPEGQLRIKRAIGSPWNVNYQRYISLEFEGKKDPFVAVPKSIGLLRSSMA